MNTDKLQKLAASVRTGGKGSMRRKKKVIVKSAGADEKKLDGALKKLQLTPLREVKKVTLVMTGDSVLVFDKANVSANTSSNLYVLKGKGVTQAKDMSTASPDLAQLQSMLAKSGMDPAKMSQMLESEEMQKVLASKGLSKEQAAAALSGVAAAGGDDDDDDDVPELVTDNFEAEADK